MSSPATISPAARSSYCCGPTGSCNCGVADRRNPIHGSARTRRLSMPSPAPAALFDLPADRLPAVAADVRRLTRRPLQFRWLPSADDEPGRVLVRVESPPAILVDRAATVGRVFTEQSPGVWVRVG